ncbi:unnamed protein product, partial [Allacma fusca]
NNHLDFILSYHSEDQKTFRVVGCEIQPKSVNRALLNGKDQSCNIDYTRLNSNEADSFQEI